jgi:hypothetical protein
MGKSETQLRILYFGLFFVPRFTTGESPHGDVAFCPLRQRASKAVKRGSFAELTEHQQVVYER